MPIYSISRSRTGNFSTISESFEKSNITAILRITVGATPTVTFKLQGSADGFNWTDLVFIDAADTAATPTKQTSITITAAGTRKFLKAYTDRYRYYRLDLSANTNVTVTDAYLGCDD